MNVRLDSKLAAAAASYGGSHLWSKGVSIFQHKKIGSDTTDEQKDVMLTCDNLREI